MLTAISTAPETIIMKGIVGKGSGCVLGVGVSVGLGLAIEAPTKKLTLFEAIISPLK